MWILITGRVFIRAGRVTRIVNVPGCADAEALATYRATVADAGPRDAVFQRAGQTLPTAACV